MTTTIDRDLTTPVAQSPDNRVDEGYTSRPQTQQVQTRTTEASPQGRTNRPADRQAEREAMALANYDLVKSIAYRLHSRLPRSVDVDDLIGSGMTGLMEAIDRYDSTRAVPFEAFAKPRIQGAIVDMLRSLDWVPRTVRRRADHISKTKERLQEQYGRTPNRNEMANAIDITPHEYDRMVRNSQVRTVLSLDTPAHAENPTPLVDLIGDDSDLLAEWENEELKAIVVDAIRRLPERERIAVRMYYLEQRPLLEVGAELGVSESRASQLHRRGIERLRFKIRDYLDT